MAIELPLWTQSLEAVMLLCFGVSWPVAVFKTVRTRRTEGVSLFFLALIFVGYLAGIAMKLLRGSGTEALEPVTALYIFNALMVGLHLTLVVHCRRAAHASNSAG